MAASRTRRGPAGLARSLLHSPALQAAALHGVAGLGFALANLLFARALPTTDYALLALAVALINLGCPLAPLGLQGVVVRTGLEATPALLWRGLLTATTLGLVLGLVGIFVYDLAPSHSALIGAAIVGGGTAVLASARFQRAERFPISIALSQASSYVLLIAATLVMALGIEGVGFPLAAVAAGQVFVSLWGWHRLLRERHASRQVGRQRFRWMLALLLAGVSCSVQLMAQLERLVIPKLLSLEDLAVFSVLAAIVAAPFRMLQMGVGRTLVPRLRNASTVAARRRLLLEEAAIVLMVATLGGVAVWFVLPFLSRSVLAGKYEFSNDIVLAILVIGLIRVLNVFVNSINTALGQGRELVYLNGLMWLSVGFAVLGAVIGSRWGLPGTIYGIGAGWLVRLLLASYLAFPHLRKPSKTKLPPRGE